ncbi:hypothetical protein Slin14017_G116600 [Septoria linicola]|nr:hypothetical protein Slin14017_G116600 [Septoria linicola]
MSQRLPQSRRRNCGPLQRPLSMSRNAILPRLLCILTTTLYPDHHYLTTTIYQDRPGSTQTSTVQVEKPCHPSTSYSTTSITLPAGSTTIREISTSTAFNVQTVYRDSIITSTVPHTRYITRTVTSGAPVCCGGSTYINSYNATIIYTSTTIRANTTLTSTVYSSTTVSTTTVATQTLYSTTISTETSIETSISTSYLPSPTTITADSTTTLYLPSFITIRSGDESFVETRYFPSGTATITSYLLNTTTISVPGSTETQYIPSFITVSPSDTDFTETRYFPSSTATITSFYPTTLTVTEPASIRTIYLPSNDTSGGGRGGGGMCCTDNTSSTNSSDLYTSRTTYLENTYITLIDRSLEKISSQISNRLSIDLRSFFSEDGEFGGNSTTTTINASDISYLNSTLTNALTAYFDYSFRNRSSPLMDSINNLTVHATLRGTPWWAIVLLILLILFGLLMLAGLAWLVFFRSTHVCKGRKSLHEGKEVVVCAVGNGGRGDM